jgi:Raf kinase inhibitor-like YbhB/YbcL family protein
MVIRSSIKTYHLKVAGRKSHCNVNQWETHENHHIRKEVTVAYRLTSSAFEHEGSIPSRFTCDGEDISPPLAWSSPPGKTASFALIVDDPDAPDPKAPKMTWVHWVLYNISGAARVIEEGVAARELPEGTLEGNNDWKKTGYGGPCPPIGRHRYFHKLYALDCVLSDLHEPTKTELLQAMEGHILGCAELIGTYQRS